MTNTSALRTYEIVTVSTETGRSETQNIQATSWSEAFAIAERMTAYEALFGITPNHYESARAEGLAINEADGLLL